MDTSVESLFFLTTMTLISGGGGAVAWMCAGPWAAVGALCAWAFSAGALALRGPSAALCFECPAPYDVRAAVAAERAELDYTTARAERASKPNRL